MASQRSSPSGKDMVSYYDGIALGYNALHQEEQERKYHVILGKLAIAPGDRVLDVGCGTGLFFRHLPRDSWGIDPSSGLLAHVAPKFKARAVQARAESLPFPDHHFDVVVSVTALQNMGSPQKALEEMKRVGKDRFAITFLKRSPKSSRLQALMRKCFPKAVCIEEGKDLVFVQSSTGRFK